MRLVDALAAMDVRSFERLCRRRGVVIDGSKRLSGAEQAARALADRARRVRLDELPEPARRAAHHLAGRPRGASKRELGGGVMPLLEQDLVFAVPGDPDQFAMPSEFRALLPPGPAEERGTARLLLSMADETTQQLLGRQLLGRQPVGPPALWMGALLERLESEEGVRELMAELSPKQRRLLEAAEARGGQLETAELLDLERSPVRVELAAGAALPSRSAAQQLLVRGLLLPRARGVWAVPTEVARHVGAARRKVERQRRKELLAKVTEDEDLSPARARLAADPGPAAVAVLAALEARGARIGGRRAVRRSDLKAAAAEAGAERDEAELWVSVARGAGAELESCPLAGLGALLFSTWRRTGVWDEARAEPDAHRADDVRLQTPTPTRGLREALLELLEAMPPDRFAPVAQLCMTAARDLRNTGAARMLERARQRHPGHFVADPEQLARRIVTASLPRLGAADLAEVNGRPVVRASARARRWLSAAEGGRRPEDGRAGEPSRWDGGGRLRVGASDRVGAILSVAAGVDTLAAEGGLVLRVEARSVQRGLQRQLEPDALRARLEALASPLDPVAEREIEAAAGQRVRLARVAASAFLPIEDVDVRQRIMDDPELRDMVVARSPESGLLVREGVRPARLERALARIGITLTGAGE